MEEINAIEQQLEFNDKYIEFFEESQIICIINSRVVLIKIKFRQKFRSNDDQSSGNIIETYILA
jgi:hypothetical protein